MIRKPPCKPALKVQNLSVSEREFYPFFTLLFTVRRCPGSHFPHIMRESGGYSPRVLPNSETGVIPASG